MLSITSSHNPRLRQAIELREPKARRQSGLYLIEGLREIERFFISAQSNKPGQAQGACLQTLFISQTAYKNELHSAIILNEKFCKEYVVISDELFAKISLRESPDGLIGIAEQKGVSWEALDWNGSVRLLVAQTIEKPGNLGALLRLADATGVKALILADRKTDIWNPNVIRASMGSFFHIPVLEMSSQEAISKLKDFEIQMVSAWPEAKTMHWDLHYSSRIAVIVGAEDHGLTSVWDTSDVEKIRLPMLGMADSLNVATAAGVCLYEILRQHHTRASL